MTEIGGYLKSIGNCAGAFFHAKFTKVKLILRLLKVG